MKFSQDKQRVLCLRWTNPHGLVSYFAEKDMGGSGQAEQESVVNSGSSESASDYQQEHRWQIKEIDYCVLLSTH